MEIKITLDGENGVNGEFTDMKKLYEYWKMLTFAEIGYTKVHVVISVNDIEHFSFRLDMTQEKHFEHAFNFFNALRGHALLIYEVFYCNKNNFELYKKTKEQKSFYKNVIIPLTNYFYILNNYDSISNEFYNIILNNSLRPLNYYTINCHEAIAANCKVYKNEFNKTLTNKDFKITSYKITDNKVISCKWKLNKNMSVLMLV